MKETLTAHYLGDPAFSGWTARDLIRWAQERDASEMPKLPPGVQPVAYRYQRLSRSVVYDFVQTAASEQERYERAFLAGIVEVTGGRYGAGWRPTDRGQPGFVAASPEELDEAGVSLAETWDVGQWIYSRSILGKDCAPRLPALPSSLLAWDALERPSAEPSPE